jgi:hypothetical protein
MKDPEQYRTTDWIDPRIEIGPSRIQGKGMFATAPIKQGETVNIWGGTLLLARADIEGTKASEWRAKGYVWATIGEGLYLAGRLSEEDRDLTNFINHSCEKSSPLTMPCLRGTRIGYPRGSVTVVPDSVGDASPGKTGDARNYKNAIAITFRPLSVIGFGDCEFMNTMIAFRGERLWPSNTALPPTDHLSRFLFSS